MCGRLKKYLEAAPTEHTGSIVTKETGSISYRGNNSIVFIMFINRELSTLILPTVQAAIDFIHSTNNNIIHHN